MADVFLSYKKEERTIAIEVVAALEAAGYSVWWDDDLTPRTSWDAEIEREIAAAKAVLVLWSPRATSEQSFVRKEAGYALDHSKLVPAWIVRCDLPIRFRDVQTTDLSGWNRKTLADPNWLRVLGWIAPLVGNMATNQTPPPSIWPDRAPVKQSAAGAAFSVGAFAKRWGVLMAVLVVSLVFGVALFSNPQEDYAAEPAATQPEQTPAIQAGDPQSAPNTTALAPKPIAAVPTADGVTTRFAGTKTNVSDPATLQDLSRLFMVSYFFFGWDDTFGRAYVDYVPGEYIQLHAQQDNLKGWSGQFKMDGSIVDISADHFVFHGTIYLPKSGEQDESQQECRFEGELVFRRMPNRKYFRNRRGGTFSTYCHTGSDLDLYYK